MSEHTQPNTVASGRPEVETTVVSPEQEANDLPERIVRDDIEPKPIPIGGTELVLQRHGKYIRDKEDPRVGSLAEEAVVEEEQAARAYFEKFLAQLPEEERASVDVLVVASDTQYSGGGRRSLETGNLVLKAAKDVLSEQGISPENVHNARKVLKGDGESRTMSKLREPNMFKDSPDFVQFLSDKYGDLNLDFWIAFEEDTEKETRLEMGAEGPDEIADRTNRSLATLARYADFYHRKNPGRRLIIWAASHYDTISPFVKRDVFGVGKEVPLAVDHGAGITIDIAPGEEPYTVLGGLAYPVLLR